MKKAAAVCFGPAFDAQDPGKLEKKRRREAGVFFGLTVYNARVFQRTSLENPGV